MQSAYFLMQSAYFQVFFFVNTLFFFFDLSPFFVLFSTFFCFFFGCSRSLVEPLELFSEPTVSSPPSLPLVPAAGCFSAFSFFLEKQVEKPSKIQPKVRDLGNGRRSPKAVAKLAWKSCGGKISAQLASLVSFVLQCHERVDVRSPNMEEAVKK